MLEKMLLVLAASYVGLRMLLPEDMHDTLLHVRDIKHAQRLAREMSASTGFSFDDDVTMWAGSVQGEANASRHIKKVRDTPAKGPGTTGLALGKPRRMIGRGSCSLIRTPQPSFGTILLEL